MMIYPAAKKTCLCGSYDTFTSCCTCRRKKVIVKSRDDLQSAFGTDGIMWFCLTNTIFWRIFIYFYIRFSNETGMISLYKSQQTKIQKITLFLNATLLSNHSEIVSDLFYSKNKCQQSFVFLSFETAWRFCCHIIPNKCVLLMKILPSCYHPQFEKVMSVCHSVHRGGV